jgi:hypothetical protein
MKSNAKNQLDQIVSRLPKRLKYFIRYYQEQCGLHLPISRHEARKLRGIGAMGVDIMQDSGVVVLDDVDKEEIEQLKRKIVYKEKQIKLLLEEIRIREKPDTTGGSLDRD